MQSLSSETTFFHDIAERLLAYVEQYEGSPTIHVSKREGDYATEIDLTVEDMIVDEIRARFPDDRILAEERYAETTLDGSRVWIIDPICGTTNLRRGLSHFCTNIALARERKVIAACVIDYSRAEYFWSVGDKRLYINQALYARPKREAGLGKVIDINLGALGNFPRADRQKYVTLLEKITLENDYFITSMNSSLAFAYAAVGKIDGFIAPFDKAWDIAAASFILQQAGGVIGQLNGEPWALQPTISSIGSLYPGVYENLQATRAATGLSF